MQVFVLSALLAAGDAGGCPVVKGMRLSFRKNGAKLYFPTRVSI